MADSSSSSSSSSSSTISSSYSGLTITIPARKSHGSMVRPSGDGSPRCEQCGECQCFDRQVFVKVGFDRNLVGSVCEECCRSTLSSSKGSEGRGTDDVLDEQTIDFYQPSLVHTWTPSYEDCVRCKRSLLPLGASCDRSLKLVADNDHGGRSRLQSTPTPDTTPHPLPSYPCTARFDWLARVAGIGRDRSWTMNLFAHDWNTQAYRHCLEDLLFIDAAPSGSTRTLGGSLSSSSSSSSSSHESKRSKSERNPPPCSSSSSSSRTRGGLIAIVMDYLCVDGHEVVAEAKRRCGVAYLKVAICEARMQCVVRLICPTNELREAASRREQEKHEATEATSPMSTTSSDIDVDEKGDDGASSSTTTAFVPLIDDNLRDFLVSDFTWAVWKYNNVSRLDLLTLLPSRTTVEIDCYSLDQRVEEQIRIRISPRHHSHIPSLD